MQRIGQGHAFASVGFTDNRLCLFARSFDNVILILASVVTAAATAAADVALNRNKPWHNVYMYIHFIWNLYYYYCCCCFALALLFIYIYKCLLSSCLFYVNAITNRLKPLLLRSKSAQIQLPLMVVRSHGKFARHNNDSILHTMWVWNRFHDFVIIL